MFDIKRVIFRVTWAVLLMLLVMGISCGDEADESVSVDVREVEGSSPPASSEGESQFAGELKQQEYDEAEAPEGPVLLRWDFSGEDVFEYTYKQEVRNQADMGGVMGGEESEETEQEMSGEGSLVLRSKGDGTAELVLKDVKMIMKGDLGSGDTPDIKEQTAPPVVIQGIKEDGSGSFGNNSQDMFLRLLFPLPEKELSVGESAEIPMQMPFTAVM